MKYTIKQFNTEFPDDDACLDRIMQMRYGDQTECPKCEKTSKFHRVRGRRQYACQYCGHQIAPCAGTVFEKSRTSLKDWFYAMYLFTSSRHGVPAKELERQLGVTYKTAWRMGHQLRKLMQQADHGGMLGGHVEIDETYVGGRRKPSKTKGQKRLAPTAGKTPVFGMVERQGRVRAGTVEKVNRKTVEPIIKRHIARETTVSTDEGSWYKHLKADYKHDSVSHIVGEYVRGDVHVNSIEGFWSRLKNSVKGTHIHVSGKHLNKYVCEFVFRYNGRHAPGLMFDRLLAGLLRPSVTA